MVEQNFPATLSQGLRSITILQMGKLRFLQCQGFAQILYCDCFLGCNPTGGGCGRQNHGPPKHGYNLSLESVTLMVSVAKEDFADELS